MKKRHWITALLLAALLLTALGGPAALAEEAKEELNVLKVENLPEDFILGMDVSSLIAQEASLTSLFKGCQFCFGLNTVFIVIVNIFTYE